MANSSITMFEIKKLFNKYDIKLNLENNCNVLIGANGIGKSTILKILYFIAIGDFTKAPFVPFESIVVHRETDGENKIVEVKYDWFFPEIEYLVAEYIGVLRYIDEANGSFRNQLEEMLGNAGAHQERVTLFANAMMELKEKMLYGIFVYDLFHGIKLPYNIRQVLAKYKIDYELLATYEVLRVQKNIASVITFEGSELDNQYVSESIDEGWLDFHDLSREFFYFDLVQNYVISNEPVKKSFLFDAETNWAFSERKREGDSGEFIPFPLREKVINSHPEIMASVHGKTYDDDIFFKDYSLQEYFEDDENPELKPIRDTLYREKILQLNELINRAFYSRELILDINNRIKKYSDIYYADITNVNEDELNYEEIKARMREISNLFTVEVKLDYETFIRPILVNDSFFDCEMSSIRNDYSYVESEYLNSVMDDLSNMMDEFPYEIYKKVRFRELFIEYIREVLPILKNPSNRSSKINKYESIVKKYLADKYIEIRPSGLIIKDGIVLSSESPIIVLYDENDIDLSVISSGERKILIMFAVAIFFDEWVLILDEPELSLSLVWQESLIKDMMLVGNQCNVFAATHSPYIVRDEIVRPYITYLPQG